MTFLERILPSQGTYCVAMARPSGGFNHHFYDTVEDAQRQIDALDGRGHTVFMAQAGFDKALIDEAKEHNAAIPRGTSSADWKKLAKKVRGQVNVAFMRNFFFDIDCGEGKDYPSQKEAVYALKAFVDETGLPMPAVVNSGNGLYAHWLIEEDIPAQQWKSIATILKKTAVAYGFNTDPMRTADSASVLRPPGATHRKDQNNPKQVTLIKDMEPVKFIEFVQALAKAAKKKQVDTTPARAPKVNKDINADFYSGLEYDNPASLGLLVEKCNQLKIFRNKSGNVSEPAWYANLGIMVFCDDTTDTHLLEWSAGHPDATPDATLAKAQQYKDSGVGPTTCAHFGTVNPEGCIGCPHNGKIKSPIVLGRPEPEAIEVETPEDSPPEGYKRTKDGLHYEDEGRWFRFYDQDLWVDRIALDETLGYQVAIIKHKLPHDGELEFPVRSSQIHDAKALMVTFSDNHVHVLGMREAKVMVAYVSGYIAQLQRQRKMTHLLNQMGWKGLGSNDPIFVLGKKIFRADGSVENASLAQHAPAAAKGFRTAGDLSEWVNSTALLDKPGMEAHAFALLCGFAAPLMKFTGFDGAIVSLVGDSGSGKTLMLRWAQSIYGYHKDLMMLRDDTRNSLISRLGVYGNLPLVVDEVTNIDGAELSDLVYRVTQGRDKARLTKNSVEKTVLNGWNTVAMVTTNSSLVDKLSGLKHDASAEINRVLEYPVHYNQDFSGSVTDNLFWVVDNNYGHIGEKYIQWLTKNHAQITPGLRAVQQRIDADSNMKGEERFWSAIAATAIYGGIIAKSLGLIKFDVGNVMEWASKTVRDMRGNKEDLSGDAVGILGQFLDEHASNRILVKGNSQGGRQCIMVEAPRGPLVIRHEIDNDRLYFSRNVFRTWLSKKYGVYSKVRAELQKIEALKNAQKHKVIGGGTSYSGASQPCWEIDLTCQALGSVGLRLVKDVKPSVEGEVAER